MKYIESPDALNQILPKIEASSWVAVDTEADSLHHYIEKLCLAQVSVAGEDYVIDPLASLDLAPLVRILEKKELLLHGADFDLRILKRFYNFSPPSVFDTMIAAQILGYDKQGFADLAEKHCGVKLSKKAQRADWSERPLTEELLTYAANDTHYLKAIADIMKEELIASGRSEWHRQFCERMTQSALTQKEAKHVPGLEWQVKGSKDMNPKALTILKELWNWREEEGRRRDRPTFKIIHSDTLIQIAEWSATQSAVDVANLPNAPRHIKGEYRNVLNQVVSKAKTLPPTEYTLKKPIYDKRKWSTNSETLFNQLKAERERLSKELKLQPSLLVTNAVLEELVLKLPRDKEAMIGSDLLMPWQAEVVGESLLKILYPKT